MLFTVWLTTVFILVSPLSGHLETDELASIQYAIDISDKPLLLDDVSSQVL